MKKYRTVFILWTMLTLIGCSSEDRSNSANATAARTAEPTIAPTKASSEEIAAMKEYWGHTQDIILQAKNDAVSAYNDGNDRSMAANYLSNCSTNAGSAKGGLAFRKMPDGWNDVRSALDSGLTQYATLCTQQKSKLYSNDDPAAGRAAVSELPSDLQSALQLARKHLSDAGGDPDSIGLP